MCLPSTGAGVVVEEEAEEEEEKEEEKELLSSYLPAGASISTAKSLGGKSMSECLLLLP